MYKREQIMRIYHVGDCPVCGNYGRMEVLFDTSADKCFVMCEECHLEFSSMDDYRNKINGRRVCLAPNDNVVVRPATLREIQGTEWYPFISELP